MKLSTACHIKRILHGETRPEILITFLDHDSPGLNQACLKRLHKSVHNWYFSVRKWIYYVPCAARSDSVKSF